MSLTLTIPSSELISNSFHSLQVYRVSRYSDCIAEGNKNLGTRAYPPFRFICFCSPRTASGPSSDMAPWEYFLRGWRWKWRSLLSPRKVGKNGCFRSTAGVECWMRLP